MKANPDKCHLLLINESCKKEIKIAGNIIEKNTCGRFMQERQR